MDPDEPDGTAESYRAASPAPARELQPHQHDRVRRRPRRPARGTRRAGRRDAARHRVLPAGGARQRDGARRLGDRGPARELRGRGIRAGRLGHAARAARRRAVHAGRLPLVARRRRGARAWRARQHVGGARAARVHRDADEPRVRGRRRVHRRPVRGPARRVPLRGVALAADRRHAHARRRRPSACSSASSTPCSRRATATRTPPARAADPSSEPARRRPTGSLPSVRRSCDRPRSSHPGGPALPAGRPA